ncbi:MAG: hypothetical protein F6K54_02870 [Okeania sp. SIO3B5]|nr:hypothetical protein [Okeania sp. SIO3B5]NEO52117.1 hypothetical protein [Okeania sp. SIO3B5]
MAVTKVICHRGFTAVGQIVEQIDCVGVLSGTGNSLDKCHSSSKPKS